MAQLTADSDATEGLLERIRAGDAAAVDRLLERHRPQLRLLVQLRLDGPLAPASIRPTSCRKRSSRRCAGWRITCNGRRCLFASGCGKSPTTG